MKLIEPALYKVKTMFLIRGGGNNTDISYVLASNVTQIDQFAKDSFNEFREDFDYIDYEIINIEQLDSGVWQLDARHTEP